MNTITIDRALVEQALKALEMSRRFVYADNRPQCDDAIDALRAALAQQQAGSWQDGVLEGQLRERERWLAQQADKPQRPKCFEFALDFLGTPENGELLAYIEQLEARAALAQQAEPKGGGNLPPPLQAEPVDFVSLLREADEIVRGKPTWKRFIDGTPLSNDIAVWMTVFAQDVARRAAPPQRKPLTDEEIYDMYNEPRSDAEMVAFARAVEAAHGIKERV